MRDCEQIVIVFFVQFAVEIWRSHYDEGFEKVEYKNWG